MTETVALQDQPAVSTAPSSTDVAPAFIPTGILPVDARIPGLERGGSYLIAGTPGPAKMVAALHFLRSGLEAGERALLLTNAGDEALLGVARAWGFDFDAAWRDGSLRMLGFKDDFELRALRSVEPEEVLEELNGLAGDDVARIAVDPGSMFLGVGTKSLLGTTFLKWARHHPATVCTTLSVDGASALLPSTADWLIHSTTGRLVVNWRSDEIYEITLAKAAPKLGEREEPISVQLKPGTGLIVPEGFPARRGQDRPGVDDGRLLLIHLGGAVDSDLKEWATTNFEADLVDEPFEAIARVQGDAHYGSVLVHAPRREVRKALQACRALRPLTRAAIVFVSDDAVRSNDRIQILEAGADDCLTGGIDFRELSLRLSQAIATGSKPLPEGGTESTLDRSPTGGPVDPDTFEAELEARAADSDTAFFCVLDVASSGLEPSELEEILVAQVRTDEGDLVTRREEDCVVLLQGAREGQLGPFVSRLRERISERTVKGADATLRIEVLSHPSESAKIRKLLRTEGARAR